MQAEKIVIIIFGLILFSLLLFSNYQMFQKRKKLAAKVESLQKEMETLSRQNDYLKQGISEMTEQDFLEKEAIERFNLKPPGTEVVVVKREENEEEKKQVQQKTFLQSILEMVGLK